MTARVIITGAASGIGAATGAELRRRGASVVGLDLHADGDAVLRCDVRDQSSVDHAVGAAVVRLGGLDALVNSAGLGLPQSATSPPGDDAAAVLDVNLVGPWRVSAAALPALRASRGRIINIASGLSFLALPLAPAYCMSKRGLVGYSDVLRYELGGEVTVTTVYPGYVRTPIHAASQELGFGLEGTVPAEDLDEVARRITRAVLGRRRRDIATSRSGTIALGVLRVLPRGLVDMVVSSQLRRYVRQGGFADSPLAADLVRAVRNR